MLSPATPKPASWVVPTAAWVVLFLLGLAIHGDYGITWDEEIQQQYGEGLIRFYASFGQDQGLVRHPQHASLRRASSSCSRRSRRASRRTRCTRRDIS
jgi:hypothetical protein